MSKRSQDQQYTRYDVSQIERKEKNTSNPYYILQYTLPLTKISYTNPPPMSMTTLISKTTSRFCHEWQRVRVSSRHLVSAGRASIIILISIRSSSITIIVLILRGRWRRRSSDETTHGSLASCDTINTGVHQTQLIIESVEASMKLRHDVLKSHTARGRRGSRWS